MEGTRPISSEVGSDVAVNLADDYMWGFDSVNEDEGREIGLAIANGWCTSDEAKRFTTHSLLRGVEEWDQMISCATAMRERATPDDPLEGHDLLTYLSKLVLPHVVSQWVVEYEATHEEAMKLSAPPPAQTPALPQQQEEPEAKKGTKRKRKNSKNNDSPYFATLPSVPQLQPQPQAQAQPLETQRLPQPPSPQQVSPGVALPEQTNNVDTKGLNRSQRRKLKKLRMEREGRKRAAHHAPQLQPSSAWYLNGEPTATKEESRGGGTSNGDPPKADIDVSLKNSHS